MNALKGETLCYITVALLLSTFGCRTLDRKSDESDTGNTSEWGTTEQGDATLMATAAQPPELKEFPDLVLPEGFVFLAKRSYTGISEKYRIAHLVYEGKQGVSEVVNFYRDQMPISGWKLEYVMGMENKTLDFVKEEGQDNRCRVQVISGSRKTEVVLDIY